MNRSILTLAAIVLLMLTANPGEAAEPIHVYATPEGAASVSLIARADRALREYVVTCSTSDDEVFALALLEMRGDRILKPRHFGTLSTTEAPLLARAIASSRLNAHD